MGLFQQIVFRCVLAVASAAPAFAALAEIYAEGSTVATYGPAPELFHRDSTVGNQLEMSAVFDVERPPVELTETSAVYEALYGVGTVNGVSVPLYHVTLEITRVEAPFSGSYLLRGSTAEGWTLFVSGYSEDPAVVPSLEFPRHGFIEPAGELYRRWDIDARGPGWASFTDQILLPTVTLDPGTEPPASAPSLHRHPRSVVAKAGSTTKLDVKVAGVKGLTYQWFHNGRPIPGETGDKLFLKPTRAKDAGWYWVVVTNGDAATTSAWARVTVR